MKSSGPRFFSCFLWCFGDLATVETVWLEWLCNLADSPPTMPTIGMTWMILPKGWFFGGPNVCCLDVFSEFFLTTVISCISPFHNGIPGIQTFNIALVEHFLSGKKRNHWIHLTDHQWEWIQSWSINNPYHRGCSNNTQHKQCWGVFSKKSIEVSSRRNNNNSNSNNNNT